jgi:hypothetical protein
MISVRAAVNGGPFLQYELQTNHLTFITLNAWEHMHVRTSDQSGASWPSVFPVPALLAVWCRESHIELYR